MQNALGNSKAIEALCGGFQEFNEYSVVVENPDGEPTTEIRQTLTAMHFGEDFSGPKTIVGDTFIINRKTGQQVPVKIVFYQFLPDSIFNLTQDAEGDATVFDMNGDLLTTVITVGEGIKKGVFYSILDPVHLVEINAIPSSRITLDANGGSFVDGEQQRSMVRQFAITKNKYETPTRDKYDFVDWYYDQNQTDYVVDNISIDQPTTLYAGWAVQTVKETWHSSGSGTADTRLQTLTLSAPITFDSKYVTGTLKISGRINALIGSARVTASVYETELYWSTSKTAEYDEWKPLIKNGRENFLDSLGVPLHIQIRSRLTPTGQVMDDPVTISYKKTAI